MSVFAQNSTPKQSLPARGVWIEIWPSTMARRWHWRRSPQGECGLKCVDENAIGIVNRKSLPARGVWIEISLSSPCMAAARKSLPARGVWIEIGTPSRRRRCCPSLPARGVWIEIVTRNGRQTQNLKSLPARGVWIEILFPPNKGDAVGRSPQGECGLKCIVFVAVGKDVCVAPRKGSVD